MSSTSTPAPAIEDALHTTLEMPFDDALLHVQLEHELAGFETVTKTRLDHLVEGVLEEEVRRTALLVVCHAEIARDALRIDQSLAAFLPCTTTVYEDESGTVHVHHVSTTKAMRDLGCAGCDEAAMAALVEHTGELMTEVWENIEANAGT